MTIQSLQASLDLILSIGIMSPCCTSFELSHIALAGSYKSTNFEDTRCELPSLIFFPIKFICCGVLKPGFYNPPKSWFKCGIIRQMVDCKWMNPGRIKWRALFIIMGDRVRCESNSMCCAVVFILAFIILLFCFGLFIYGTFNNNFYPWNWLAMPPLNRKSHKFLGKNTILVCVVY